MGEARKRRPKALKPVGLTDDGFGILLSGRTDGAPSHLLRIDGDLVALLEEARTRLPPVDDVAARGLSPRQIQALLRRGQTVDDVARKAGVPVSWVERFAPPIEWERAGMAERTRRAIFHRPRLGPSALPLGEAVRTHVSLDDEVFDDSWDAVRASDDPEEWIVTFTYRTRGSRRRARWAYRPRTDEVRALDRTAAALAWASPRTAEGGAQPEAGDARTPRGSRSPRQRSRRRSSG